MSITNHRSQLQELSTAFVSKQEILRDEQILQTSTLKEELQQQLEQYQIQAKKQTEDATAVLKSRATVMENVSGFLLS